MRAPGRHRRSRFRDARTTARMARTAASGTSATPPPFGQDRRRTRDTPAVAQHARRDRWHAGATEKSGRESRLRSRSETPQTIAQTNLNANPMRRPGGPAEGSPSLPNRVFSYVTAGKRPSEGRFRYPSPRKMAPSKIYRQAMVNFSTPGNPENRADFELDLTSIHGISIGTNFPREKSDEVQIAHRRFHETFDPIDSPRVMQTTL